MFDGLWQGGGTRLGSQDGEKGVCTPVPGWHSLFPLPPALILTPGEWAETGDEGSW